MSTTSTRLSPKDQLRLARGAIVESILASALDPVVTMALLESVQPSEDIAVRIDHARQVIEACTAAGVAVNASYIRRNTDITEVRSDLIEAKAKADATRSPPITLQNMPFGGIS